MWRDGAEQADAVGGGGRLRSIAPTGRRLRRGRNPRASMWRDGAEQADAVGGGGRLES
jgi:hypothetical protein